MSSTKNPGAFSPEDPELTFDMRFHAFVLAAPRVQVAPGLFGVGMPVIAMNGGDRASLVLALRSTADHIEQDGTETLLGEPLA